MTGRALCSSTRDTGDIERGINAPTGPVVDSSARIFKGSPRSQLVSRSGDLPGGEGKQVFDRSWALFSGISSELRSRADFISLFSVQPKLLVTRDGQGGQTAGTGSKTVRIAARQVLGREGGKGATPNLPVFLSPLGCFGAENGKKTAKINGAKTPIPRVLRAADRYLEHGSRPPI